ncbi:MAG: ATPase, T2SS/T4P/T4SS family, partial [Planctomycetaceae bacterium]
MATELDVPVKAVATGEDLEINKAFRQLIKHDGSDLHLQVGKAPILRVKGALRELQMDPIDDERMKQLLGPIMDKRSRAIFDEDGGADFAHVVEYEGESWRFRVNMFTQLGSWGLVARKVERTIPSFSGLYLPSVMEELCKFHQGMILLAGVTGSGKSTTIASMLNWINANYRKHVLT